MQILPDIKTAAAVSSKKKSKNKMTEGNQDGHTVRGQ
jgi:hypothetical protein